MLRAFILYKIAKSYANYAADESLYSLRKLYQQEKKDELISLLLSKVQSFADKIKVIYCTYLLLNYPRMGSDNIFKIVNNLYVLTVDEYEDEKRILETCPECGGDGYQDCSYCEGDGKIDCRYCDGEGNIECSECDGSGTEDCSNCDGYGTESCDYCGGDGDIESDDYHYEINKIKMIVVGSSLKKFEDEIMNLDDYRNLEANEKSFDWSLEINHSTYEDNITSEDRRDTVGMEDNFVEFLGLTKLENYQN